MDIFQFELDPSLTGDDDSTSEVSNLPYGQTFTPIEEAVKGFAELTLEPSEGVPLPNIPTSYTKIADAPRLRRSSVRSNSCCISEYEIPIDEEFVAQAVENNLPNKHKVAPQDFERIAILGKGAYGTGIIFDRLKVYLVRQTATQQLFAMKVLRKASLRVMLKGEEHTKAERTILEEVQHPFIVKLFYAFQTRRCLYLILDFVPGGELFFHMANELMFSEDVAVHYSAQLVLALEHLHGLGIIYRLKICLLDRSGNIVLTDFGLSKVKLGGTNHFKTNTICGTTEYMAPEILAEQSYDASVDWWSLGVLIYDMLTGSVTPFRGNNRKRVMDIIMKTKLRLPHYLTPAAKDLLGKTPAVRLGSSQRGGVQAIKSHAFFRKVDWDALYHKRITATNDLSNFDAAFTSLPVPESPEHDGPSPPAKELDFQTCTGASFHGFSYVAPSAYLHG
ncbi:hypothetical protein L0F63_003588 [Massospora cicadina]|nr:hypothetical protein L0F63_003588 [Massospora cicadina]